MSCSIESGIKICQQEKSNANTVKFYRRSVYIYMYTIAYVWLFDKNIGFWSLRESVLSQRNSESYDVIWLVECTILLVAVHPQWSRTVQSLRCAARNETRISVCRWPTLLFCGTLSSQSATPAQLFFFFFFPPHTCVWRPAGGSLRASSTAETDVEIMTSQVASVARERYRPTPCVTSHQTLRLLFPVMSAHALRAWDADTIVSSRTTLTS